MGGDTQDMRITELTEGLVWGNMITASLATKVRREVYLKNGLFIIPSCELLTFVLFETTILIQADQLYLSQDTNSFHFCKDFF